jgi:hypothetical protein
MRKIEDFLREAPLRPPSRELSGRVEQALQIAESRRARWFAAPVPLWASAVAALACLGLGYWARTLVMSPAPRVVYIIPADAALRRFLMGEAEPSGLLDPQRVEVTVVRAGGKKL